MQGLYSLNTQFASYIFKYLVISMLDKLIFGFWSSKRKDLSFALSQRIEPTLLTDPYVRN